jgi:hypothetical protein
MGETQSTKTSAGETCSVAKIDLTNLLDSEVGDPTDYDLILVGGGCANSVVGQVPGLPACGEAGISPGEGIIQLAANGDKVAMLVAGATAADTRAAAKVIANYGSYNLNGMSAKVTGTAAAPKVGSM